MFRIKNIFENQLTTIFKIEGEITDKDLRDWADEINKLLKPSNSQIILEFCEVTYISPKAVGILIELISDHAYLTCCPTFMKNMLHSAGLSQNILD